MKLRTYLNYGGNCQEAFRFYERHLGGKIIMMMTHGEMPDPAGVAPEMQKAILHARITIGDSEIFGSDVPPERFQPMRSAYLSLAVDSADHVVQIDNPGVDLSHVDMLNASVFTNLTQDSSVSSSDHQCGTWVGD